MRRRNPGLPILLIGGAAAGVAYFLWRRSQAAPAPAPGPLVHEPPAAEQPPPSGAPTCYEADRPAGRAGYDVVCGPRGWRYRKSRAPVPLRVATLTLKE